MASEKLDKDLVPTKDTPSDKQIIKMVDNVSSDDIVRTDGKETTLLASPEHVETAIESREATESLQVTRQKSACVFTSRCVLPPPSLCKYQMQNCGLLTGDCLFVYGRPKCVVHATEEPDVTAEMAFESYRPDTFPVSNQIPYEVEARTFHAPGTHSALMLTTSADVRSAAVITSQCKYRCQNTQQVSNQNSFLAQSKEDGSAQTSFDKKSMKMMDVPTHDDDPDDYDEYDEECDKAYLVGSCRYYGLLLSKQLDRVRQNITKRLTTFTDSSCVIATAYTEACTMKPSAREEFGCQTLKNQPYPQSIKFIPTLYPAVSVTDIGRSDKEYLKSVYYMLTAIEGRLRRFKTNIY